MTTATTAREGGALPVTAIVLSCNEERNLPDCLASLVGWCARVFVVDSGSTDRTVSIACELGAEVVAHPFEHYGAQRNWALDTLPIDTPWVLNVDADERVTPELRASIADVVARDDRAVLGYLVSRRTMFMGRWIRHGGHYPAWHLRLFRTGIGRCEERLYDQHFQVPGRVERLPGDLIDTLTPDVATFVRRHVRWAQLEADEQERALAIGRVPARLRSRNAIERRRWLRNAYNRLPLFVRPVLYFLYRYIVRLGVLDGREGLVFHFIQGFWYRMMVDALLFERRVRRARMGGAPARGRAAPVGEPAEMPAHSSVAHP